MPRILADSFTSGDPLKHAHKHLVDTAELGDKGAMIRVFEKRLGVVFREAQ